MFSLKCFLLAYSTFCLIHEDFVVFLKSPLHIILCCIYLDKLTKTPDITLMGEYSMLNTFQR